MNEKERISLSIHGIVLSMRDTLSLPTHATLEKTLYFSLALLACSVFSELTRFYTFISWQGCLICIASLVILLWIERSENDALLKMYRAAKVSTEKALRRAKTAGTSSNRGRSSAGNNRSAETSGKREQRRNTKSS